ncbi:MAG TPA: IS200/IS605 family element transposase accessory protein TnpB [Clostridia bacterium]|jgi:putative transposase|nr:IS200/IS605 family accessory protein TnpB-related protein [Clostridia bacterium]HHY06750.1 IS200/IS605 family element transposase accessory protein TnpB [Clostridia bacterium]
MPKNNKVYAFDLGLKDFQHQLFSRIINENQIIIGEDLGVKNMIKNQNLAKRISDVAWSEFCRQLAYKSQWYGRTYHQVDRWFASSQTCSECGAINKEVKLI